VVRSACRPLATASAPAQLGTALAQVPGEYLEGREILIRADSDGATHGLIDYCREADLRFSVGYELTGPVREAILEILEDTSVVRQARPAASPGRLTQHTPPLQNTTRRPRAGGRHEDRCARGPLPAGKRLRGAVTGHLTTRTTSPAPPRDHSQRVDACPPPLLNSPG